MSDKPTGKNSSEVSPRLATFIETLITYRRLVFSLVFLSIAVGVMALGSMARQEDPSFPYRAGLIKVFYPGGTPSQIEKLITEPLEEELAQVAQIDEVTSTSRDDLAIFSINLQDYVYDTDAAWDRVETAIERARLQFPNGVSRIEFDDRQIDMPAAVVSVVGSDDPILLEQAALRLKRHLIGLNGLSRIEIEGAPAKEVVVKVDPETISRLGISRQYITQLISQRNQIVPGGLISSREKNIRLNTQSDYDSLLELKRTIVPLPSGQRVPLESIADVKLEPRLPLTSQVFQNGQRAVSLGIIAERGQVDIIEFGAQLRERLATLKSTLAPLEIQESFFQPDYTQDRLLGLRANLIISVLVIAAIIFFAMGWRTGLMVSAVLPVVAMISIGVYSAGGGVFHQMAVIGMVIALGILIDNAIVVVEYMESSLRKGVRIGEALRDVIKVMAKPLLASTGTTVAAFIPLLLADGGVGDFTRAVPIMIVISLLVSYLISILVLPLASFYWLRDKKPSGGTAFKFTDQLAQKSASLVSAGPIRVLFFVALLLGVSLAMAPFLKQEFFPSTDRAQIVVDVELPNNTPLAVTARISREMEQTLLRHDAVEKIYRNVGGAGFRFYYNMVGAPNESHIARLTINTRSSGDNQRLVDWVRQELKPAYPDAVLIPRLLGQGPPRQAPIEVRVKHDELATLYRASQAIKALLSATEGVSELRSNLDLGTPELQLSINDVAALNYGLQPNEVAGAVFSESRGLIAGEYRYETDPVPIRVRSSAGQYSRIEAVESQTIYSQQQVAAPLNQMAAIENVWTPTTLRHHDYQRTVTVLAQVKPGFAFNQVLADFKRRLPELDLAANVDIEFGGDAAASEKANQSIATAAPIALGVLIFFMMFQFNSFRRIGIVFVSIPLAAVGVIPGLAFSGQPFGFQSLLGVIALIGIVVNNAIVLIDVVDQSLARGEKIDAAVQNALEQRTAPILLTTATTILGLLPLALSSSTLWPPMAWAIISGLSLSTVLTLVAIPALCILVLGKGQGSIAPICQRSPLVVSNNLVGLVVLVGLIGSFFSAPVQAAEKVPLSPELIKRMVKSNSTVAASEFAVRAVEMDYQGDRREAWAPRITVGGAYSWREDISNISLPEPIGSVTVTDDSAYRYEVKLTQPLFNPGRQRYDLRASRKNVDIANYEYASVLKRTTTSALTRYYQALSLFEVQQSLRSLEVSLEARLDRINKELAAERVLKTDVLQVRVALNRIKQRLIENQNELDVVYTTLRNLLDLPTQAELQLQSLSQLPPSDLVWLEPYSASSETLSCFARDDCLALQVQLDVIDAQKKAISSSYLPNVNLSLSNVRSDGLLFAADRDKAAMLEFSWALFDGGKRTSQSRALSARKNAVLRQVRSKQQAIQLDIRAANAAIDNARTQRELAQSSVVLDQERLRLSQQRYDGGLLNIDELLDAEASFERSKSDLARAFLAERIALVELRFALGADF